MATQGHLQEGSRRRRGSSLPTVTMCTLRVAVLLATLHTARPNSLASLMQMEEYKPRLDPHAPYGTVWYNGTYLYLPAPPGKNPPCARGGMTYCSSIKTYPSEVIGRLLVQWKYDLSTVFSSENRDILTSGLARNISNPPPPIPQKTPHHYPTSYRNSQPAFRPIQGHRGPSLSFHGAKTSPRVPANHGGYTMQMSGGGFLYSMPTGHRTDQGRGGATTSRGQPPYNPVNWAYSFLVPRQKRQAIGGGSQLCPTTGQYVTPKAGLNNRGEWRFVINMGETDQQYTQLVRAERCLSSRCSGLCTIPTGMTATCEQQYVQKKMVGLDPSGTQMYTDLYWVPHCCVCQIQ